MLFCMAMGFLLIVSTVMVYGNEDGNDSDMAWPTAIVLWASGFLTVFFTSKYLNPVGKRWRPVFIGSFFSVLVLFFIGKWYGICF